jgi:hypothetical protein
MTATATTGYSARSIKSLDNGQLLRLFAIVCRDITRRIRLYSAAHEPAAVLDGLKFAAAAHEIGSDVMHGVYPYSLYSARDTLTRRLSCCSFDDTDDDVLDGVDLDG